MKVRALYTEKLKDPFENLTFIGWEFEYEGRPFEFLAPKEWSALAVEILWNKFARKKGVPPHGHEYDARSIFKRLAAAFRIWGEKLNYFDSGEDALIFEREILYMLAHQIAAPNSPQWFNTGLYEAYQIEGGRAEGHYAYDFESGEVRATQAAFVRPQAHACFIQAVSDELISSGGIFDLLLREARLFKYGSGTGSNFSSIRGRGERLAGGGSSSGLMSFLDVFDRSAGVIQSGGTTRRAAKMVCLDADHPDVLDFINYKKREEEKVAMLILGSKWQRKIYELLKATPMAKRAQVRDQFIRQGVSTALISRFEEMVDKKIEVRFPVMNGDWEGEAYKSVSGQNANFSLRLTEVFFEVLKNDGDWDLKDRTTAEVRHKVKARDLWRQVLIAAWASADPGLQFHDTINEWNTCPKDGPIRASNPCSEYMFLDETACNLASLNLMKFMNEENQFQTGPFIHACELWTMVLDISVSMASYPSKQMAINGLKYRTLGLGFANLGAVLMRQGLAYDSASARAFASGVAALMTGAAYHMSARLAQSLGSFEAYEKNKNSVARVLALHEAALVGDEKLLSSLKRRPLSVRSDLMPGTLFKAAQDQWEKARLLAQKVGVRNAQVSVIAPTGTIGLLMDCDTTGIEPEYSLVKYKKLAGGRMVKIVNQTTKKALLKLRFTEEEVTKIQEQILHEAADLSDWIPDEEELRIFDCALPAAGNPSRIISSEGHLLMMAAVQPFISGAISKTVNLPYESTPEDIGRVYERARFLMLKAVAIYRDGSKLGQPLTRTREVVCAECGQSGLISTGSCFVCPTCGTSTGCS